MSKKLTGAAKITSDLNHYGNGKGMIEGIKRIAVEQRKAGFAQGVNHVFQNMSLWERVFGTQVRIRK